MGHAGDLKRDRLGDRLLAWAEEVVGVDAVPGQQPRHRLRLGFQPAVGVDVADGGAAFVEGAGDEQGAVAIQRFLLGAHDGGRLPGGVAGQLPDGGAEIRVPCPQSVIEASLGMAGGIVRPPSSRPHQA